MDPIYFNKVVDVFPTGCYRGSSEDQGYCPYCQKLFQRHLLRHIQGVHFKVKAFQCEYCGARFSQKSHKLSHVNRRHRK